MIVYRVQDINGRGPWKPGFSQLWVEPSKDHDKLIPWFHEFERIDFQLLPKESAGYGCLSLEQLRRWFTELEYQKLVEYGYQAVKIKAAKILASSPLQCVFTRLQPLCEDVSAIDLYPKKEVKK